MKAMIGLTGKCTMQFVQSADSPARYRSSLLKEDRSIAGTVTDREDPDTKNRLI